MTTASGSLGSKPQLIIRGVSSMSAGTDPLYVIDGIPYGSDFDMNNLNPADIESMTVLKDAASNALYGARGANGVIMITTKKAKLGDAVVNVDMKWGLNTKALKSYDYITEPGQYYEVYYSALRNYYENSGYTSQDAHFMANQTLLANGSDGGVGYQVYDVPDNQSFIGSNGKLNPNAVLGRIVDYNGQKYYVTPDNWLEHTYHNSPRQEYNVSVSGTTGKASILASFGYLNNKGIVDGSDMYRYTARIRTEYQAKEWLKIGANVSYTNYNWNNGNSDEGSSASTGNVFAIANQIAPIYPLFVRDGNGNIMTDKYGMLVYDYGTGENAGMTRPLLGNSNALQAAQLDKSNSQGNALNGTAFAEVKFLRDFTFTFNAGMGLDEMRGTSVQNMYYG
jgi:TonB-dependent SusC/RagA subfamily outer membrane receptor